MLFSWWNCLVLVSWAGRNVQSCCAEVEASHSQGSPVHLHRVPSSSTLQAFSDVYGFERLALATAWKPSCSILEPTAITASLKCLLLLPKLSRWRWSIGSSYKIFGVTIEKVPEWVWSKWQTAFCKKTWLICTISNHRIGTECVQSTVPHPSLFREKSVDDGWWMDWVLPAFPHSEHAAAPPDLTLLELQVDDEVSHFWGLSVKVWILADLTAWEVFGTKLSCSYWSWLMHTKGHCVMYMMYIHVCTEDFYSRQQYSSAQ